MRWRDAGEGIAQRLNVVTQGEEHGSTLRAGTLGFSSVLIQGVTHIAPAVGLVLSIQYAVQLAGTAAPMAFLVAFVIILMLGISLTQLARHHPSAGGYYTYISRTINHRAGFLTAWIYFLYDPATTAVNLAFMGYFLQGTVRANLGVNFPWWLFFLPAAGLVTLLTYRGIEISAAAMIWLTGMEVLILAALSTLSVLHPGPGGVHWPGHTVASMPVHGSFYLAVVFAVFCFTGFESVAPLAEETEDPRRNLPRSILFSIAITGFFFIVGCWATLTGWGVANAAAFAQSTENPVLILAKRLMGRAWILVFLAVFNSVMAASIAGTNASTRVFFAMSRSGSLPPCLGKIHTKFKTPVNAIWLQTLITLVVGLGVGLLIGPDQEYYFLGIAMTLALIFVYAAGNLGVVIDYCVRRREELRPLLHVIFPVVSTVALLWAGYASIVPLPPAPIRYAPFLAVGWMLAGAFLALRSRKSENA